MLSLEAVTATKARYLFSFGAKAGKRRNGNDGGVTRQQQVIDGANAWIEIQTVVHSYQLAVKKERLTSSQGEEG